MIIGSIIGIVVWLIFYALGIIWLGYLFATIFVIPVGWTLKVQSHDSIDYFMDFIAILCCVGIWLILMYTYDIEWAKALFLSSLFILFGGIIGSFKNNYLNE